MPQRARVATGLLVAVALSLLAPAALAAPLGFTGTLSIQIFAGQPLLVVPGSGTAQVTDDGNVHLLSLDLLAGSFGATTTSVFTTGSSQVVLRITGVSNRTGSFAGLSGGPPGGGAMGLTGSARICFFSKQTCPTLFIPIPIGATSNGGFGIGGTQATSVSTTLAVTAQHAAWTIGQPVLTFHLSTTTVVTPTLPGGFAHGPASGTSSTAQTSGTLQLVTVSRISTSVPTLPEIPVTGILNLHFVPEPGTLVLLMTAAATMLVAARRCGRPRR